MNHKTRKYATKKTKSRQHQHQHQHQYQHKHKWSLKYKRSIDCKHPKGFSQKQHCKYGRKNWKKT